MVQFEEAKVAVSKENRRSKTRGSGYVSRGREPTVFSFELVTLSPPAPGRIDAFHVDVRTVGHGEGLVVRRPNLEVGER